MYRLIFFSKKLGDDMSSAFVEEKKAQLRRPANDD
jgi:hypothetical protein